MATGLDTTGKYMKLQQDGSTYYPDVRADLTGVSAVTVNIVTGKQIGRAHV